MEKLLSYAMDIGEQMIKSGAEVYRVEESLLRMCKAFGFAKMDVYTTTNSMVVTVVSEDGTIFTQTRRILSISTDFEKMHRLNKLSRKICEKHLSGEEIQRELDWVVSRKVYPFWLECLAYAVIAGAFTLFFGGNITEMAVSLFVGAAVRFGILLCDKTVNNRMFTKFFSAFLATLFAYIALKTNIINSVDKVIIGNIMSLIPGIGLTNALRDLFTGDSIAGLLRSIEAVITALAIAAGYFVVAILGGISL